MKDGGWVVFSYTVGNALLDLMPQGRTSVLEFRQDPLHHHLSLYSLFKACSEDVGSLPALISHHRIIKEGRLSEKEHKARFKYIHR
jgi:hypothetical protein